MRLQVSIRRWFLNCFWLAAFACGLCLARAEGSPGVAVKFTSDDKTADTVVWPNFQLYVPAGESPTPFLPGGKFTAEWNGFVSVDLRADYQFEMELGGEAKLEINGKVVLEAKQAGKTEPTPNIRLNKGTNAIKITFNSPASGDAYLRLFWFNKETARAPIPVNVLTHSETPELNTATQQHTGRELFAEFRCVKCHLDPAATKGMAELSMDAPSFEGIGSRRNYDWMAQWILDPKALRPTAHMPKLLRGDKAKEDAAAIAAFLASQKGDAPAAAKAAGDVADLGAALFEKLHCAACHNPPGGESDPAKISLAKVAAKFSTGALHDFLQKPQAHYAWIKMPDFHLNAEEIGQLAGFLLSKADKPADTAAPTDQAVLDHGRDLLQTTGCLNCHSLKLENKFSAKTLASLAADKWSQGCLAESPAADAKAPQFNLSAEQREALRVFAGTDRTSLTRHVATDFAERQARLLNCRECHGKFEGFPAFELIGGKLKPEWMTKFIAGQVSYKPRPWLESRMPYFPARAEGLGQGLAMRNGLPPVTPPEPPLNQEMAKVGQQLVSPIGGFSCVSCHGVAQLGATQVFESAGINLAYTGERLQKAYFERWLRNPLQVDSNTKMPVYFDEEGRSPLADIYEGDGFKQRDAIWQYIRLGDKMPPPPLQ